MISEVHQFQPVPWASPKAVLLSAWPHRKLIYRLARREIEARYRGSLLGLTWSLLVPLALLGVYTFLFTVIFHGTRWGLPVGAKGNPALLMFSGMIVFNLFAECANRAPWLMLGNVEYIKRVVFPLEALTWVVVLVALFNAVVSAVALLVGYVVFLGWPPAPATLLALPLVILPLLLVAVGVTWFLSSLGVYLRDVAQFVPVIVMILMFLHPVFYSVEALPKRMQPFLQLSPIAVVIEEARAVLFYGRWPNWWLLGAHLVFAGVIAWLGCAWFLKTRKGFADVL
jgi:lipopolysaccharide transport system permease protein